MQHLAFLTACYKLGTRYHTGQWSRGYRLACLASERCRREHSALNIGRVVELLDSHSRIQSQEFRDCVAYHLRKLARHRHSL
jgi:hypothetical protein